MSIEDKIDIIIFIRITPMANEASKVEVADQSVAQHSLESVTH